MIFVGIYIYAYFMPIDRYSVACSTVVETTECNVGTPCNMDTLLCTIYSSSVIEMYRQ